MERVAWAPPADWAEEAAEHLIDRVAWIQAAEQEWLPKERWSRLWLWRERAPLLAPIT